jgi:HD superfamily phosphohydrolase
MTNDILINDPVHGFIKVVDPDVQQVLQHKFVQRLRYIKQLGLTHLVYPGACHSRFSHAIGAMHLMSRAITTLKQKNIKISDDQVQAAQCAMLLHDIGHSPFSHALEYRMFAGVSHEEISLAIMHEMNAEFNGKLSLAIRIFQNQHEKKFLHQLISSQMDMDRLDYLARDGFFAGVAEGSVGVERIIQMLNVVDNQLVIEEKGIYPVEQFLIARRQMYWQVYLHKSVVAAEQMIIALVERMRFLIEQGETLPICDALLYFLRKRLCRADICACSLEMFGMLIDGAIDCAIAHCAQADDHVLRRLCMLILERRLPFIEVSDAAFSAQRSAENMHATAQALGIEEADARYFAGEGVLSNNAYSLAGDGIKIRCRSGEVRDIAQTSDMFNATAFMQDKVKYFVYGRGNLKT